MRICAWRVPCRFWLVCTMSTLLVLLALAPALRACCPDTSVVRHALTSGSFGRPLRAVLNTSDVFAGPARREMILFADGLLGFFGSSGPANAEQLDAERTLRRSIIVAHCVRPPRGRPPDDDGVVASSASSDVKLYVFSVLRWQRLSSSCDAIMPLERVPRAGMQSSARAPLALPVQGRCPRPPWDMQMLHVS